MERARQIENVERRGDKIDSEASRPPCRFFLLGKCKFGDSCTFSHDLRGRLPVCNFFEKSGNCRYGNDCRFLHHAASEAASRPEIDQAYGTMGTGPPAAPAVELAPGDKCGICLENIPASGKRFGLLNCDHVYCLECLRTWRKSKGPQKDISRTCPECRKVSFFLVPSKEHLKGKDKMKAIQEYKKGLSKLPCKYHKSDGSTTCPFGWRCFYAHLDENGVDVKDRAPAASSGASGRRTCPYMRNGGGRNAGRHGASSAGRGSGARGSIRHEDIDSWEAEALAQFRESTESAQQGRGRHMSVLMHLQQLMFEIGNL